MYRRAHKTATLTPIQHTVGRGQKSWKFADILNNGPLSKLSITKLETPQYYFNVLRRAESSERSLWWPVLPHAVVCS